MKSKLIKGHRYGICATCESREYDYCKLKQERLIVYKLDCTDWAFKHPMDYKKGE